MKIVAVEKKINEIVNRLEKTKQELYPDLAADKENRDREERNEKKAQIQEQKKKEKDEVKKKKEMEELRCFEIHIWTCTTHMLQSARNNNTFLLVLLY